MIRYVCSFKRNSVAFTILLFLLPLATHAIRVAVPPEDNSTTCTERIVSVVGISSGVVWGSGPYGDISDIGAASVHAGLVAPGERATVKVTVFGKG